MNTKKGYFHSFESFGTKDGPGIRFVFFMQGCPLRCQYCHNPDTWNKKDFQYELTPEEALSEIEKVKEFVKGRMTVSGGEPLMQADFLVDFFKLCKEKEMHTALDTSGIYLNDNVKSVLENTDLVLLDIKHIDSEKYQDLTSQPLEPSLKFMEYLSAINKPTWVRYVLVPGVTNEEQDLQEWAEYVAQHKNVERVDVLPFHQMAVHKWTELNYDYKLKDVEAASKEDVQKAEAIFKKAGLPVAVE